MDVDLSDELVPHSVEHTEALRAFQQVMLCLKTDDGITHVYSVAPLRAKWLIAQLEAALLNPDQ